MKFVFLCLSLMNGAAAFAADASLLRLPAGAVAAPLSMRSASEQQIVLACELYKTAVENGKLGESVLMAAQKSIPRTLGTYVSLQTGFPAPFEDVSVAFSHLMVSYRESGERDFLPYAQSFFMGKGKAILEFRDASFDMQKPQADSKLKFRGAHGFDETSMLSYQCSLLFVE